MPGMDFNVVMEATGRKGPARTQEELDEYLEAEKAVVEANERKKAEFDAWLARMKMRSV